jgi:hypothetical protein
MEHFRTLVSSWAAPCWSLMEEHTSSRLKAGHLQRENGNDPGKHFSAELVPSLKVLTVEGRGIAHGDSACPARMEALGEVPHPAEASARMLGRKEHAHTASQRGECVLCKRKVPLPGHLGLFYFIAHFYFIFCWFNKCYVQKLIIILVARDHFLIYLLICRIKYLLTYLSSVSGCSQGLPPWCQLKANSPLTLPSSWD